MKSRTKTYSDTACKYAYKLRKRGYVVHFNWVDDGHQYEDVTVVGHGEFSTPRKAWESLVTRKM